MPRILAIEPDPNRGAALKHLVQTYVDAHVVLASSTQSAIVAMARKVPDLVLTSSLLPPDDDARLIEHLRTSEALRHLPVLTIPPVVNPAEAAPPKRRGLRSLFRRRQAPPWPAYSPEAVGTRIREALEYVRRAAADEREGLARPFTLTLVPSGAPGTDDGEDVGAARVSDEEIRAHCGQGVKRLRAHRWMSADLPWLSAVRLPWGLEVALVNISSSGLLIESGTRFMPGTSTTFRLAGPNREIVVPARIVRSRVASVDCGGVTYRAAAVFDRTLDDLEGGPQAAALIARTDTLARLRERLTQDAERGAAPAVIRASFERSIQQFVTAREIRLRDVPVVQDDGADSVYFSVNTPDGTPAVLQATFEPGYCPTAREFDVLKQAAGLAAEVLLLGFDDREAALA